MDAKTVGLKVRELRTQQGYTTITLAKRMKLSQAQVSRLENGLQGFRGAVLLRFARVLKVDPAWLLTDGKEATAEAVAQDMKRSGLLPSRTLVAALKDKGFMRFIERCAKAMGEHKKNLVKMERATRGIR